MFGFNVLNTSWQNVSPNWAGESPQFPGLDQVNIDFPKCAGPPATSEQRYDTSLSYIVGDPGFPIATATLNIPLLVSEG